jgi:hypothetical protein
MGAWSPVLRAMFNGSFKEANMTVIPLPGKRFIHMLKLFEILHPPISPCFRYNATMFRWI